MLPGNPSAGVCDICLSNKWMANTASSKLQVSDVASKCKSFSRFFQKNCGSASILILGQTKVDKSFCKAEIRHRLTLIHEKWFTNKISCIILIIITSQKQLLQVRTACSRILIIAQFAGIKLLICSGSVLRALAFPSMWPVSTVLLQVSILLIQQMNSKTLTLVWIYCCHFY